MSHELRDSESVHGYVGRICFKTGPPHHVGAELEWLVAQTGDSRIQVPASHLRSLAAEVSPFPRGSTFTLEPGGQVELSSPVGSSLTCCWRDLANDVAHLQRLLTAHDLRLVPTAIDPVRPPRRQLRNPRYDAMEAYFDSLGSRGGRVMMTSTAAVQVNLDAGACGSDVARRWQVLNAIGPVMIAAFANSPVHDGRATGWKSTRQRVWQHLDPRRTAPPTGTNPVTAWAEYALDSPVMLLRREHGWVADPGFTFRDWVTGAAGIDRPTEDDLAYHLTTLFPPVRPRGWFEVRYVDAQPVDLWPVPVAVISALCEDPVAAEVSLAATEPVLTHWSAAARTGLDDPLLSCAASACFEAALVALPRIGAGPELVGMVTRFAEQYVDRSRCPADDVVDTAVSNGRPSAVPTREPA